VITIIIAGGSGTRLWPLSTPDYPKHLLKINGSEASLLQNTYKRVKDISRAVYVITEKGHANHIKDQLPELKDDSFIIEPARRGTASCILSGLVRVHKEYGEAESVVFLAADHYIRDTKGFAHTYKLAADISTANNRIVLVGIEPDYPSTGFGYIKKGDLFDEEHFVLKVHSFKEKPDFATAQKYLKIGDYLWNSGTFVGSVGTFVEKMKHFAPGLFESYESLSAAKTKNDFNDEYLKLENVAIDYALMEKTKDLLVLPASFDWMDLGSYQDLHKAVESNEKGNHSHGPNIELEGVTNSYVQNHEQKPVAVIGLDNIAVINSPNGLLVTRKDLAQAVGDVSKRFKKER